MKQTTYELLALLDRNLRESIDLLKRITSCPGHSSDRLAPLMNEVQYVRAQIGYEVTSEASEVEQGRATRWGRIHNRYLRWLKDPDDVYLEAEDREKERKKLGLPQRIIVLPWDHEIDEKLLSLRRDRNSKSRRGRPKQVESVKSRPLREALK